MQFFYYGLPSRYEAENVVRLFYPAITLQAGLRSKNAQGPHCFLRAGKTRVFAGVAENGEITAATAPLQQGEERELTALNLLFKLLCAKTGYTPAWGMLTGVRPVALLRNLQAKHGVPVAEKLFKNTFKVSEEKYALAAKTAEVQAPVLAKSQKNSYSLYISIPFCPSRCSYCSFVSRTTAAEGHLIPQYIEKLVEELAFTAQVAQKLGLNLETLYIGGGTPTALTAAQLQTLLAAVGRYFPLGNVQEYTVEAGRPDTVTQEKLAVLKNAGVSRISINPQTLDNKVLKNVGRPHTAEDFYSAFTLAKKMGFDNINTDLIAGLPGDTPRGFRRTVQGILALAPENVTVHTLTLKRASNIVIKEEAPAYANVEEMLRETVCFSAAGYLPYYMYRQKGTLQNLENTGYTKPGFTGLYNVHMMEETMTVLSCGAGGATKLLAPYGGRIERIFNYKYPGDYIQNFDKLLLKKQGIEGFYAGYMDTETFG